MPRKKSDIHYIYKTTCLINNRYYIGMHSTCNIDDGYMGSGKRLRYSIRKYGLEHHKKEIVKFFETRELLVEGEKKAITPEMVLDNNCMNLKEGGCGGFINEEHENKFHQGTSKWLKEQWNNEDYRNKILKLIKDGNREACLKGCFKGRTSFKGKKHSEKSKKLMSKKKKGKGIREDNSQYGTCWITKNGVNKKIKKEDLKIYLENKWNKGRNLNERNS